MTSPDHDTLTWPGDDAEPRYAYVTMVTSDDFVVGAQLLSHSLRKHGGSFPLLCLVTRALSPASLHRLSTSAIHPVLVDPLPAPFPSHVPSWSSPGLTKLRVWQLTRYRRVLYLDSDCLVCAPLDQVLAVATAFAAAPDLFPPTRFNAGVLLLEPSLDTFARLVRRMEWGGSYDGGDTGFLNGEWEQWWEGGAETRLSFGYNAQRTLEWMTRKAGRGYWDSAGPVHVVHYSSSPKVWERRSGGRLERAWWEQHDQWREEEECRTEQRAPLSVIDLTVVRLPSSLFPSLAAFPASLTTSFDASMGQRTLRAHLWSPSDSLWLAMLRRRYETHSRVLNDRAEVEERLITATPIPGCIHQIWLGGDIPDAYAQWMASWPRLHPTWEHRLHTSLDGFPHSCASSSPLYEPLLSLMSTASNYAQQSDILRLDLLLAYGGVYVDADYECVQPLDALHSLPLSAYCGLANVGAVEVGNSIIACAPGHPLIAHALRSLRLKDEGVGDTPGSPMEVIERTGPGFWTRTVCAWLAEEEAKVDDREDGGVLVLPASFLYPLPNCVRELSWNAQERQLFVRAESLAVHHWGCSWQSKPQAAIKSDVDGVDVEDNGHRADCGAETKDGQVQSAITALLSDAQRRELPDQLLSRISAFL